MFFFVWLYSMLIWIHMTFLCLVRRLPRVWWMCLLFMYDFSISFYVSRTHDISSVFFCSRQSKDTLAVDEERKRKEKTPKQSRMFLIRIDSALVFSFSLCFHIAIFIFSYWNGIPIFLLFSLLLKKLRRNMYAFNWVCAYGMVSVCLLRFDASCREQKQTNVSCIFRYR